MTTVRFTATIKIYVLNPYIVVSKARATSLRAGWRKPMPVLVRINGRPYEPWHINMMPVGDGNFWLYLHGDLRKVSGTKVGDRVTVELEFDEAYRNGPLHPMPEWFRKVLADNAVAEANWEALSPSRQKEILRYFAGLKSAEAKARNTERALHVLSGRPGRFMAREWRNGS